MVQLSPSPTPDTATTPPPTAPPAEETEEERAEEEEEGGGVPRWAEVSTYYGYENYIEDGLICLKHKLRNLEKKKLKLEEYQKRLRHGEKLNTDQMAAVDKLEELIHNLSFTRELHKTLDGLTQNLLQAQRKAVRKEQAAKVEAERRRLSMLLQIHHLLSSLQQEHVLSDLLTGHNMAPPLPVSRVHSLTQLGPLLGVQRNNTVSLEEQMDQAALLYLDLLEGKDRPVAGSSFKVLKEELIRLLDCKYFNCLPSPPIKAPEGSGRSTGLNVTLKAEPNEVSKECLGRLYLPDTVAPPSQNWKQDFQARREQDPPDRWDMDLSDGASSLQASVPKPWRGAATYILKAVPVKMLSAGIKQRKERKTKGELNAKLAGYMNLPAEVSSSPATLPKDPVLRRQHLEELMTKIHGSFNFMQDSLLDGEGSNDHSRLRRKPSPSPSPPPLAQPGLRSPDVLPKPLHSTPLPARAGGRQREPGLLSCDVERPSKDLPHEALQLAHRKTFPSPPLYRRQADISVSLEDRSRPQTPASSSQKRSPCSGVASSASSPLQAFSTPPARHKVNSSPRQSLQTVFKVHSALPHPDPQPNSSFSSQPRRVTSSTQTPVEFASEEELQSGGPCIYQTLRDSAHLFYTPQEVGYQPHYRRGRHDSVDAKRSSVLNEASLNTAHITVSTAAWNDCSLVSSPEREGAFTLLDSGLGDSMSVSTMEVPLTPHGHQQHAGLVPMQLYPVSQALRVAFTASRTANFAPGNLDQPVVFDQLHSNLGGMYDAHIGRFTSPANGTYVFLFHILKLAVNVPLYINLMCNEDVMVSAYANDGAPDHETASNHAILPLFQGDQVWLRLHRGAIYGSTWKYSTFSGFLLYQD